MKDDFELLQQILALFSLRLTGWMVAAFLLLYLVRGRLVRLVDRLLDSVGVQFGGAWSYRRFAPRYCEIIRERHKTVRLVGLRTEDERRPLIEDAYVPVKLRGRDQTLESDVSVESLLASTTPIVILGDPGAGKSILLEHLIQFVVGSRSKPQRRFGVSLGILGRRRPTIPLYIPLRRCRAENRTLLDDVLDEKTSILPEAARQNMPLGFIKRALLRGEALLLLDGLDEVADDNAYQSLTKKIGDFVQLYGKNPLIVTCRKAGWRGGIQPDPTVMIALPLDFQQQDEFVHRWHSSMLRYIAQGNPESAADIRRRGERDATQLLSLLRSKERIRELASNPLLLSLICLVHRRKRNLPRGRAELYAECVDILLFHWDQIDKDLDQTIPSSEEKKELLRRIAHRMHTKGQKEISRQALEQLVVDVYPELSESIDSAALIRQIEVRSGLMMERSIDQLAFSHLTFQEFFVVDYFHERPGTDIGAVDFTEQAWREPALLMCGRQRNPNPLIAKIAAADPILALYAIAEADPTQLDVDSARDRVQRVIKDVTDGSIDVANAIPAIVNLAPIEGSPFKDLVLQFIATLTRSASPTTISEIIETLCKSQTRATASALLYMLNEPAVVDHKRLIVAGLARIGDPAIQEVLEAGQRGDVHEELVFELLLSCESRLATGELWARYGLTPPRNREADWAESWARRLADAETDSVLPARVPANVLSSLAHDARTAWAWPYRALPESAAACLVLQSIAILRGKKFPHILDLLAHLPVVAQYSLRVQIPLLLQMEHSRIATTDPRLESLAESWAGGARVPDALKLIGRYIMNLLHAHCMATRILDSVHVSSHVTGANLFGVTHHSWMTLGAFLASKSDGTRSRAKRIGYFTALALAALAAITTTMCISVFLPPDGTLRGFWNWVPGNVWLSVVLVVTLGVSWMCYGLNGKVIDSGYFIGTSIFIAGAFLFIIFPLFILLFPVHTGIEEAEAALGGSRRKWPLVAYALSVALTGGVLAGLGAGQALPTIPFASLLAAVLMAVLILAAICLCVWSLAFEKNLLALWLRFHPRGGEILRQFEMQ